MKPPLLPTETLRRVVRTARFDGMSILLVSGFFALVSAGFKDVYGAGVGLLIAGAAGFEVHGSTLLREGSNGMKWLIGSQLLILALILSYLGPQISHPDVAWMLPYMKGEAAQPLIDMAKEQGKTVEDLVSDSMSTAWTLAAVITVIYQGGMLVYYLRRRTAVEAALRELEVE